MNIKGMAKKAGVSVATISRAMNPETRSKVASKTLAKVDKLVEQYGYTPNLAAKNLRQSATKTIGVILPYLPGIFYSSYYTHIMAGVSDVLRETDYQFKTLLLKEEKRRWDNFDFKSGERVDGLVVTHWFKLFSKKSVLENMNVPCVVINDFDKTIKTKFVYGDHFRGGELAAEYLVSRGHRQIAVFTGFSWSRDSQQRLAGFKHCLKQKNIQLSPYLFIRANYQEWIAYQKVDELLAKKEPITAIFCFNDEMAIGAIRRLQERGIPCPEKISIMGYDDDTRARDFDPPLTTIHVPIYELAAEATRSLIAHLRQNLPPQDFLGHIQLPVHLVERKSVRQIPSI